MIQQQAANTNHIENSIYIFSLTVAVDPEDAGDHGLRRVNDDIAPSHPQRLVGQAYISVRQAAGLVAPYVGRLVNHNGGLVFDV